METQRDASEPTTRAIDWAAFYDRLRAFVVSRVRNGADADDLVQRILERAVAGAGGTEIASTPAWLFGIARNAIVDHYREQARAWIAAADALDAVDASGGSEDERAGVLECMKPLLGTLPREKAQLLQWADMEGRSMQAIAAQLGISLTATKSRVQRARKDFVKVTSECCAITLDARGRVTELTPRAEDRATACPGCAPSCGTRDGSAS